jgi:hypothetical protein
MKCKFLEITEVCSEEKAMRETLQATLKRNPTYAASAGDQAQRQPFRDRLAELVRECARQYTTVVDDGKHVDNIAQISSVLSSEFAPILRAGRCRIGTSQKALNLYLKYLWCLGKLDAPPPHCPIDRNILQAAGIEGKWTELDSCKEYMQWIGRLRECAKAKGYGQLQEWELGEWNMLYPDKPLAQP